MNKTQIAYMEDRLKAIAKRHLKDIKKKYPPEKDLTLEEKIGMIQNGEAYIAKDKFLRVIGASECPWWINGALNAFTFPKQDIIDAKNAEINKKRENAQAKIDEMYQDYLDEFVIEGKPDTKIIKLFKNHKFK